MKVLASACLGLFVLIEASAAQPADDEKRTWRLLEEKDGPTLEYGTDNVEDIPISFGCAPGNSRVTVWINETDHSVKANRSMTASLIAGSATAKVPGKTQPNEEAGTPSFSGTMKLSEPLLATLGKEKSLVFVVGRSRDQVPLDDIGDKADRFLRLCQKK